MVLLKLNVLKKQILYSFLIGRHSNLVSFLHTDMTKKEAFKLGSSLKFMFSKKATKIEKNLHHWFDTYLVNVKLTVKVWSIFEAFLENMNFIMNHEILLTMNIDREGCGLISVRLWNFKDGGS